jgi:hypothetical protein
LDFAVNNRALAVLFCGSRELDQELLHIELLVAILSVPCFGRHGKLLVPAVFAVVCIHSSFKEG